MCNSNKRRSQRLAPTNVVMITLIVLMYCMSTIHIALALRVNLIAFFDQHAIEGGVTIFDDQGDPLVWIQIMLELLNVSRRYFPLARSDCAEYGFASSALWETPLCAGGPGSSGAETGVSSSSR